MATLEKIRSKSVFLLVIIGLALLAFILTDFLTSGRTIFGNGTTVAKVAGKSIDVTELQSRVQQMSQNPQYQGADQADLQNMVLQQMVNEVLFNEEAAKLGLTVTDKELSKFMLDPSNQALNQAVQMYGVNSVADLYDMVANPSKYGFDQTVVPQLNELATNLEKYAEQQLLQAKFNNLFAGAIVANELDAKNLFDESNTTTTIAFARQDFSSLPDDQFAVSDDEINAEYARVKNTYKINEENRTINYIAVNITPSEADKQAASKKVEQAVADLRTPDGENKVRNDAAFLIDTKKEALSKVTNPAAKQFLDSAAVGSVQFLGQNGNLYTIAKIMGRSTGIEEVTVNQVAFADPGMQDSIMAALNSGALTLEALKADANVQVQEAQKLALNTVPSDSLRNQLLTAAVGQYFVNTAAQAPVITAVAERGAAEPMVEYLSIEYTLDPSVATVRALQADLEKYVAENNTAQKFADNAVKAGYVAVPTVVTPGSAHIGNLKDSRNGVRWVMKDAKKGQVSDVFGGEQSGQFYVVAVNNIYDGDYVPATEPMVKEQLTARVRNDKKAKSLIDKYAGKANDIAGYAQLMGAQVDTTQVNIGRSQVGKIGPQESKLVAKVASATPGKVVAPVQGSNSVVAFVVTDVQKSAEPFVYESAAARYNQQRGGQAMLNMLPDILLGRNKVDNRTLIFFGGE